MHHLGWSSPGRRSDDYFDHALATGSTFYIHVMMMFCFFFVLSTNVCHQSRIELKEKKTNISIWWQEDQQAVPTLKLIAIILAEYNKNRTNSQIYIE